MALGCVCEYWGLAFKHSIGACHACHTTSYTLCGASKWWQIRAYMRLYCMIMQLNFRKSTCLAMRPRLSLLTNAGPVRAASDYQKELPCLWEGLALEHLARQECSSHQQTAQPVPATPLSPVWHSPVIRSSIKQLHCHAQQLGSMLIKRSNPNNITKSSVLLSRRLQLWCMTANDVQQHMQIVCLSS